MVARVRGARVSSRPDQGFIEVTMISDGYRRAGNTARMTRLEPPQDLASDIVNRTREDDLHGKPSVWPELPVLGA